eukprot:1546539-Rhodomonas_salina.2
MLNWLKSASGTDLQQKALDAHCTPIRCYSVMLKGWAWQGGFSPVAKGCSRLGCQGGFLVRSGSNSVMINGWGGLGGFAPVVTLIVVGWDTPPLQRSVVQVAKSCRCILAAGDPWPSLHSHPTLLPCSPLHSAVRVGRRGGAGASGWHRGGWGMCAGVEALWREEQAPGSPDSGARASARCVWGFGGAGAAGGRRGGWGVCAGVEALGFRHSSDSIPLALSHDHTPSIMMVASELILYLAVRPPATQRSTCSSLARDLKLSSELQVGAELPQLWHRTDVQYKWKTLQARTNGYFAQDNLQIPLLRLPQATASKVSREVTDLTP